MSYKVGGSVVDAAGNPLESMIRVYNRATGALLGSVTSDPNGGLWSVNGLPNADPVFVVRFRAPVISQADPYIFAPGAPWGHGEIFDNVIPVAESTSPPPAA